MENCTRPPIVTVIGWYAIVMGVLPAVAEPYLFVKMNKVFDVIGGRPAGWDGFMSVALSNWMIFLAQIVAGIAILKSRNWGRFLFALIVPAIAVVGQVVYGTHVPKLEWWKSVMPNLIFTVFLFLPMASGYFRLHPPSREARAGGDNTRQR